MADPHWFGVADELSPGSAGGPPGRRFFGEELLLGVEAGATCLGMCDIWVHVQGCEIGFNVCHGP